MDAFHDEATRAPATTEHWRALFSAAQAAQDAQREEQKARQERAIFLMEIAKLPTPPQAESVLVQADRVYFTNNTAPKFITWTAGEDCNSWGGGGGSPKPGFEACGPQPTDATDATQVAMDTIKAMLEGAAKQAEAERKGAKVMDAISALAGQNRMDGRPHRYQIGG